MTRILYSGAEMRPVWRWQLRRLYAASRYGGGHTLPLHWWDWWAWIRPWFGEGRPIDDDAQPWR